MSEYTFPSHLTSIDYPAFLSQHDVVYQGPVTEGIDGLPIGNGDLGAMVWTQPKGLEFSINKVDLFDDGTDGHFSTWADQDNEEQTMPRFAGALSIRNGLPGFDRIYLNDFEGRLRLAEAQVDWRATTPFSKIKVETFISQAAEAMAIHYTDETKEPLPRQIELSRWGTPSLIHWYAVIKRVTPLSLMGTQSGCDGIHLWISQPLRGMNFVIAAAISGPARPRLLHRRAGIFESESLREFEATIYVAVAHSEETNDPLALALKRVDAAASRGWLALQQEHRRRWDNFWQASFIDLPPEQDYIENLWYLNSYLVGSSCMGKYPPNHINALWSWNRDVFPWCQYFHWNNQMHVYSLHSSGHPELALPYFRYRRAMLDHAMEDARQVHHCSGAFYADVANRKGFQDVGSGTSNNLTPGPQIAAQFWQHYQFTQDQEFLKYDAYPVIREVSCFYLDKLTHRADGCLTFTGTQPYEGVLYLRDTLTDLAHARQLFSICVQASILLACDEELRLRCQAALEKLADYPTALVSTEYGVPEPPPNIPDWGGDAVPVHFKELKPGDPSMRIWLLGYKVPGSPSVHGQEVPDDTPMHEGCRDPLHHLWIFTSTNMAPIFPSNQIGLDQAGDLEFQTAVNTVRAFGHDTQSFSLYLIARARLGMAHELQSALAAWPQNFQIYPQGFFHYFGKLHPQVADHPARVVSRVRVAGSTNEHTYWPMSLANHFSLEGGPILQFAVNEMLLQSYSGTLRVFPAVPETWQGQFRLHAAGGFTVSAVRNEGQTSYVVIESRMGQPCRIANPFNGKTIHRFIWQIDLGTWIEAGHLSGDILEFTTEPGAVYLLLPDDVELHLLTRNRISGQKNTQFKTLGKAQLGIPPGF